MRRSGILVALLALPLYVPVLVFGAGQRRGRRRKAWIPGSARCCLLAAGLVLALVLAPLAAAAALRIALS